MCTVHLSSPLPWGQTRTCVLRVVVVGTTAVNTLRGDPTARRGCSGSRSRAPGVLPQRLPGTLRFPSQRRGGQGHSAWVSSLVRVADYYSPAMLGLKTDQEVLGELVRTKVPAVAALMDGHGVLWPLVVSRWFICLFVDILPVEVSAACALLGPGLPRLPPPSPPHPAP